MDRILKLVYPYSYKKYNTTQHYYNGLHSKVIEHLQGIVAEERELFNLYNEIDNIAKQNTDRTWDFVCHSNFYHYFMKDPKHVHRVVGEDEIIDDGSIYLYPIEIKTTINEFTKTFNLVLNGETITYNFIDTIPPKVLEHMQSGLVKMIVNIIQDPCVWKNGGMILLEKLLNEHGIDGSNLIFIWGNDMSQSLAEQYPESKLKLTHGLLPLQQQAYSMQFFPRTTSLGYVSDFVRKQDLNVNHYRKKRFICFNRTMKPHRYMLAYLALKHNLFDSSYISFLNSNSASVMQVENQLSNFGYDDEITFEHAKKIHDLIPYHLDTQELDDNGLRGFVTDNNNKDHYLESYVHIISETLFSEGDPEHPFFSEKTFRPIQNLQPFIYVGEAYSLKALHDLRFKTFHPFIDERYDLEKHYPTRMKMLEKEIVKINTMPIKQLHDWYHSIADILIYNQKHFMKFGGTNPFDNVYNDVKKFYS